MRSNITPKDSGMRPIQPNSVTCFVPQIAKSYLSTIPGNTIVHIWLMIPLKNSRENVIVQEFIVVIWIMIFPWFLSSQCTEAALLCMIMVDLPLAIRR